MCRRSPLKSSGAPIYDHKDPPVPQDRRVETRTGLHTCTGAWEGRDRVLSPVEDSGGPGGRGCEVFHWKSVVHLLPDLAE